MKSWLLRLFLILSSGFLFPDSPVPAISPERVREIWEAAVEIRRKSEYPAPTAVFAVSRQLNRSGALKSEEQQFFALDYTPDGVAVLNLLYAEKNGRDNTDKKREKLVSAREERREFEKGKTPFDSDVQVTLTLGDPIREMDKESVLLAFPFTMQSGNHVFSGIARVAVPDGRPYDVRYNPSPLPLFADFLEISMRFTPYGEEFCIVSEAAYRYSGSFLFFRVDGEGSIETGSWVRLPVKPRLE